MEFSIAASTLEGIPYTSPTKGRIFYDWVLRLKPARILELGFAHGVSTCYFAAAAKKIGNCTIDAVDLVSADFSPDISELTKKLGVEDVVNVQREHSSYTYFLKKMIERNTSDHVCSPIYDLVFIDGPKDWTNDGAAFFMADKLLRNGGMIAFDDYSWTYRKHEKVTGRPFDGGYIFRTMSEEEFEQPQIKSVFELLVMQHVDYQDFEVIDDSIACAYKQPSKSGSKSLTFRTATTPSLMFKQGLKALLGRK